MNPILLAADVAAVAVLVFALYLPRRGRRELVVSLLVLNVAVLAVAAALAASAAAAGLGLGLFGVLSIIRLRSEEMTQREVAYVFATLALGLIGGLSGVADPVGLALMGAIVLALAIGDSAALSRRSVRLEMVVDRAYPDPTALRAHVERLLGTEVLDLDVRKVDLVNDTTLVVVRHAPDRRPERAVTTHETIAARR